MYSNEKNDVGEWQRDVPSAGIVQTISKDNIQPLKNKRIIKKKLLNHAKLKKIINLNLNLFNLTSSAESAFHISNKFI
jgi:hypothetical protein